MRAVGQADLVERRFAIERRSPQVRASQASLVATRLFEMRLVEI